MLDTLLSYLAILSHNHLVIQCSKPEVVAPGLSRHVLIGDKKVSFDLLFL